MITTIYFKHRATTSEARDTSSESQAANSSLSLSLSLTGPLARSSAPVAPSGTHPLAHTNQPPACLSPDSLRISPTAIRRPLSAEDPAPAQRCLLIKLLQETANERAGWPVGGY
ncbi:hypothetical protein BO71DRAFT_166027 [Aspergillus ellipticus CBS 707.79]|uniref:Uncharacterized protein n=1 Tax=Aspergillus ellipticus CBS 707.79 TaxID=1448320 RepID=A0A319DHZ4_9EURO|nr:hypothetical protein BO71DRAFT_166027 [Aspergillus ellipticus CBS 707.79]